jgi:hypothetical protein
LSGTFFIDYGGTWWPLFFGKQEKPARLSCRRGRLILTAACGYRFGNKMQAIDTKWNGPVEEYSRP